MILIFYNVFACAIVQECGGHGAEEVGRLPSHPGGWGPVCLCQCFELLATLLHVHHQLHPGSAAGRKTAVTFLSLFLTMPGDWQIDQATLWMRKRMTKFLCEGYKTCFFLFSYKTADFWSWLHAHRTHFSWLRLWFLSQSGRQQVKSSANKKSIVILYNREPLKTFELYWNSLVLRWFGMRKQLRFIKKKNTQALVLFSKSLKSCIGSAWLTPPVLTGSVIQN